jgi:WD40 repeat protein
MRHLLALVLLASVAVAAPPAPVTAAAFSTDGKVLAAGTRGVAYLIDPVSGEAKVELPGQTQRVTAVALTNDTLAVASGEPGRSGVVRVYSLKDPSRPPVVILAHKDAIYAAAFSPDGKTLATAGYDRVIHLWDVTSPGKPLRTLSDHSDAVYALAWHKGGTLLASGSADRTVKVWDATTGKRLYSLGDATDWVYAVAWSPDGVHLSAGGVDKSVRTWEATAAGGKLVGTAFAHTRAVTKVLYSADGKSLVTVGEDRAVKRWDAAKLTEANALSPQSSDALAAALHPDGKRIAVGRFDGKLELLDATTGKVLSTPLPARPKPAVLTTVTADFIQRGKTGRVVIDGQRLDQVNAVAFDRDPLAVRIVSKSPTRLEVELTAPPLHPAGIKQLRVMSEAGASNDLRFHVDRFPAVRETANSDSARTAATIPLPATIVGSLDRAGDTDFFRFEATAGQEVGVQLIAADAKKFDGILSVSDDAGRVLTESGNGLLGFVAPKAGVYAVGVADKEFRGGAGFGYRLHVGSVPVVTSVFPLGVSRGRSTPVHLNGVNLGGVRTVSVSVPTTAEVGSQVPVPVLQVNGEPPLGVASVVVGEFPAAVVSADGGEVKVPGTADGILAQPGQQPVIRFAAKKGERLIVETHAARLGSPVDSRIEILDADGHPVPRAALRCTAQTFVTFRDHDSASPGIRLETWNELRVNDFLYVGTELMRIKALPKNPDDDCQFVQAGGRRAGFLGTTPTHHPQNAPMYKVEVHQPDHTFPPNGLPVFRLMYTNDDGGDQYGKDSLVEFDPPETGTFQVRVSDARGAGGPEFAYRLTVRPPRPDFKLSVSPNNPAVWKNGGVPVTVTATRIDGFQGPIAVRFDGLLAPFTIPPTTIEAEQTTAVVTLFADGDVSPTRERGVLKAIGTADIGGKAVVREATAGTPTRRDPGDLTTTTNLREVKLVPGQETKLLVQVERRGDFKGRVPLEVRGLPHGVKVQNIGLNGILVMPDQTEREVVLYAEPWVQPMTMPIVVSARSERKGTEHAAKSVTLKVGK